MAVVSISGTVVTGFASSTLEYFVREIRTTVPRESGLAAAIERYESERNELLDLKHLDLHDMRTVGVVLRQYRELLTQGPGSFATPEVFPAYRNLIDGLAENVDARIAELADGQ